MNSYMVTFLVRKFGKGDYSHSTNHMSPITFQYILESEVAQYWSSTVSIFIQGQPTALPIISCDHDHGDRDMPCVH